MLLENKVAVIYGAGGQIRAALRALAKHTRQACELLRGRRHTFRAERDHQSALDNHYPD